MQALKNKGVIFKVGFFLALRQIRRASLWTTLLIIFVMTLTFLNLVVVSGVLVGLIEGSVSAYREQYSGYVYVKNLKNKETIEHTSEIAAVLKSMPEVKHYTVRLVSGGTVEANYRERHFDEAPNRLGANIAGIDPVEEDAATGLSKHIIEGQYLDPNDSDQIIIGYNFLDQYSVVPDQVFTLLKNVRVGSKVRLSIGNVTKEYTVKGILKAKVDDIAFKIFMTDHELRALSNAHNFDGSEIGVFLYDLNKADYVKSVLINNDFAKGADIKTWIEAQPKFLIDIKNTFALLGNAISSIGLVVAAVTLFIVIFINAITRRRYIGILKGIGISELAIEISYVLQSIFYAVVGSGVGLIVVYGLIKPALDAHPINFPFSDGILVAPLDATLMRVAILVVTTVIAGYIPAKLIVRRNTLSAILGR
jgi:ABC-type lipoprotein release transport system permease subunit